MQKELGPAYWKFCSKCGRPNHFSTVCMSSKETLRQRRNQFSDNRRDRRDVRRATNESETDDSESDEDRDQDKKVNKVSDFEKTVPIVINDVIVHMEPDNRADVNVMDEYL